MRCHGNWVVVIWLCCKLLDLIPLWLPMIIYPAWTKRSLPNVTKWRRGCLLATSSVTTIGHLHEELAIPNDWSDLHVLRKSRTLFLSQRNSRGEAGPSAVVDSRRKDLFATERATEWSFGTRQAILQDFYWSSPEALWTQTSNYRREIPVSSKKPGC